MGNSVSVGGAVIAIVMLGFGGWGCTRLQALNYADAQGPAKVVTPGAKLRIVLNDGTARKLRVTGVEGGAISGVESGRVVKIPLNKVREIDRRVPAPGKTAALASVLGVLTIQIKQQRRHCRPRDWVPPPECQL